MRSGSFRNGVRKPEGFTLIEILIAVTISAFLFTGLINFVGSGLASVSRTQKSVANGLKGAGIDRIVRSLSAGDESIPVGTWTIPSGYITGVLLETRNGPYPYVFLGAQSFTGYCDSNPSLTLQRLVAVGGFAPRSGESLTNGTYVLDPATHSLYSAWSRIMGTGDDGSNADSNPSLTELSHPSSVEKVWNMLYVADTGNSRVLAYDTSSGTVSTFLDASDGILSPVSLKNEAGALLVGTRNGLFRIRESSDAGDTATVTLSGSSSITFDQIELSFSGIASITSPNSPTNIAITGVSQNAAADTVSLGSTLLYSFSGSARTLNAGTSLNIAVSSLAPAPTGAWQYTMRIRLLNGGSEAYAETFPYFVKGDGDLASRTGNIIEQLSSSSRVSDVTGSAAYSSGLVDYGSFLTGTGLESFVSGEPVDRVTFVRDGNTLTLSYRSFGLYDCTPDENHRMSSHVKKIRVRNPD